MKFRALNALGYLFLLVILGGCSATSAEYGAKGAAAGAVSASFVGAVTDLIIDGKVDSSRLERNLVGGAVAGGTAGAVAGYKKDKAAEQKNKTTTAQPVKVADSNAENEALEQKIGQQNVAGLNALVACQHEAAYRIAIQTAGSENADHSLAGLILQAMVDNDRRNTEGVARLLPKIVETSDKVNDLSAAQNGLEKLQQKLTDERQIQGLSPVCQTQSS